jgi:Tfp pilus assembly protein PilF
MAQCSVIFIAWDLGYISSKRAGGNFLQVLDADCMNVKALFRRAQANSAMMDLELAEQDIKKALEIDPENRSLLFIIFVFFI